jgi:uroporphyrinogen-III synthase
MQPKPSGLHDRQPSLALPLQLPNSTAVMEPSEIPVILLKTKSHPADPYGEYFSTHPLEADFKVPLKSIFVPVLQHRHVNLEHMQRFIQAGKISSEPNEKSEYYGLIITSQRAVEALGIVLKGGL